METSYLLGIVALLLKTYISAHNFVYKITNINYVLKYWLFILKVYYLTYLTHWPTYYPYKAYYP